MSKQCDVSELLFCTALQNYFRAMLTPGSAIRLSSPTVKSINQDDDIIPFPNDVNTNIDNKSFFTDSKVNQAECYLTTKLTHSLGISTSWLTSKAGGIWQTASQPNKKNYQPTYRKWDNSWWLLHWRSYFSLPSPQLQNIVWSPVTSRALILAAKKMTNVRPKRNGTGEKT